MYIIREVNSLNQQIDNDNQTNHQTQETSHWPADAENNRQSIIKILHLQEPVSHHSNDTTQSQWTFEKELTPITTTIKDTWSWSSVPLIVQSSRTRIPTLNSWSPRSQKPRIQLSYLTFTRGGCNTKRLHSSWTSIVNNITRYGSTRTPTKHIVGATLDILITSGSN
jgi:hypothetical protein